MRRKISLLLLLAATLSGCGALDNSTATPPPLTPYATRASAVPATIEPPATLEPPPASEQPTQITHEVQKGEDMGGIATKYGVKTKDLKEANPKIDPRMIPIGTVLIIPSGDPEQDAYQPTAIPTPALILQTGAPVCYADPSGGAWCLMKVENTSGAPVEDISADFVLSGSGDVDPQTRVAYGLLDRLPDSAAISLAVYFPQAPTQPWQINTRLRTSSPVINGNNNYLASSLSKSSVEISADRLSAHAIGTVNLLADQSDANIIQVTGVAYNAAGQPVGVRRWESTVGLDSGSGLVYDFSIYSLGGPIDRVDILGETRLK